MSDPIKNERKFAGIDQLSLRSIILGTLGSCIITASSMYIALRMSALPWPTMFVAVLSMALLKLFGKTTLNEINITQSAMSAGAMVAGGLAFTLPGLWITGVWKDTVLTPGRFWMVLAIALAGTLLGSLLTWVLRQRFVEQEALPYPIGEAAAATLQVGDAGGKRSKMLFGTMGFSAVFTLLRDNFGWIPGALVSKWLYARNFYIGIWVSPMAAGIGYMIGTLYTGVWFLGALLSFGLIVPLGTALRFFPSAQAAVEFKNTAGIGLMIGTGIGILLMYLVSSIRQARAARTSQSGTRQSGPEFSQPRWTWSILTLCLSFILTVAAGLSPLLSVLLLLGVLAASTMASTITGQTGINPMEIFGIIILLAIRWLVPVDTVSAFLIAAGVAVACGYSGDLMNDYKAGHTLGTNPMAQLVSQVIGGLAGTVIATFALFALVHQYGGFGAAKGLPAAQAFAVTQMVGGIGNPTVLGIAVGIGILLYIVKVPAMTLGIGMYLPFEISSIVFLGGLARWIVDRIKPNAVDTGNIAASGLLGGEGITGVGIAIYKMLIGG